MVDLPVGRVSGAPLKALVTAIRKTPLKSLIVSNFRAQLGIDTLRKLDRERTYPLPQHFFPVQAREHHAQQDQGLPIPQGPGFLRTASRLQEAYERGEATPEQITTRAIEHARRLSTQSPSLGAFHNFSERSAFSAARQSAERHRQEKPLGPLDGVVVPVKEEVDIEGLPTGLGARFTSSEPAERDATPVSRLRGAGAIIIGQTVMTELGLSTLGVNPNRSMPRNAQNTGHLPGGSSTGSAVAVATGIGPVALGADGGGSIRVPAALNGVFGLKPTYGRVPLTGQGMPWGGSVTHLGPLGVTSHELAAFLEIVSGPDPADLASLRAPQTPAGAFVAALGRGVRGLKIGIDHELWARAEKDVSAPALEALDALVGEGAELVEISAPLAAYATPVGYLTIGLEAFSALLDLRKTGMDALTLDLQLTLAGLEEFKPDDYLLAQRVRGALRQQTKELLQTVDLIALPTTACSAPPVTDAEAASGFVDPQALDGLCAFAFWANVTGLPAASAPVGSSSAGLPVGLQLIGDAWDEASVLAALAALERCQKAKSFQSPAYVDLLDPQG